MSERGTTLGETLVYMAFAEVGKERLDYFREAARMSKVPVGFNNAFRRTIDRLKLDWSGKSVMREMCEILMGERFASETEAQYAVIYAQCIAGVKWKWLMTEKIEEMKKMYVEPQQVIDERRQVQVRTEKEVALSLGVDAEEVLEVLEGRAVAGEERLGELARRIKQDRQMLAEMTKMFEEGWAKVRALEVKLEEEGEQLLAVSAGMHRLQEMAVQGPQRGVIKKLKHRSAVAQGKVMKVADMERVEKRVEECFADRKTVVKITLLAN